MREAHSGLYGTRIHVVRFRDLNVRGNGTEFTVGRKAPSDLQGTFFPRSPLCSVCNKGRKYLKMPGILQQQCVACNQHFYCEIQTQ